MKSDFKSIRQWDGSQHRAFEELCYQLLREPDDLPSADALPTRTGNPDGGVEWFFALPDGSEWGWQAKFIFDTDNLLAAMRATVKGVVAKRPKLARLTFCVPWNLPDGRGHGVSARAKYDNAVKTWSSEIAGASDIEFRLLQESDLLARLAQDKHAGTRLFWWNENWLGPEQLRRLYEQASAVAGPRYRPELQVDVPIADDLAGLGFSPVVVTRFARRADELKKAVDRVAQPRQHDALREAASELPAALAEVSDALDERIALTRSDPFERVLGVARAGQAKLEAFDTIALRMEADAWHTGGAEGKAAAGAVQDDCRTIRRVADRLHELMAEASSAPMRAAREGCYFLEGAAGAGKTHLFLDSARQALEEGRPAAVLFGQQFGYSTLWMSVADQLGLPPSLSQDELLGVLDSAGEASSAQGARFVLMLDAINDCSDPAFWAANLARLQAAVEQWPHVGLAVSCRDTYLRSVDPEGRRAGFVQAKHPGFAGLEVEATSRFFELYGLSEPRVPLLLPEFTNPLFLQMYCESLRDEGKTAPDEHHQSRVAIFDRFLNVKLDHAARRVAGSLTEFEVQLARKDGRRVLDALLGRMADSGSQWVARDALSAICGSVSFESSIDWRATIGVLIAEGLLVSEVAYPEGKRVDSVRITFQAFSDHLILRHRLGSRTLPELGADGFTEWLSNASWGIREAGAIVLPEHYGVELPDYLKVDQSVPSPWGHRRTSDPDEQLARPFLDSVTQRSGPSVTPRTLELLNEYVRLGDISSTELFDLYFANAAHPESRGVSGIALDRNLGPLSMAERDAWFGTASYWLLEDKFSAASRLARWAAKGPYPNYDPSTIERATIPLFWLLSSPNRRMRDWVTKALVQLLRGHPDVLTSQVQRFEGVNDPYVMERVLLVAYGSALRCEPARRHEFGPVAEAVLDTAFRGEIETRPCNALALDAARGLVEWAIELGVIGGEVASEIQPPYGFGAPGNPWTEATIAEKFPRASATLPLEESYSYVFGSLLGFLRDFGRYVVGSHARNFSASRLTESPPRRDGAPLSADYPERKACRWIFQRVVRLGWTPKRFGEFDMNVARNHDSRFDHNYERFGKKYQWIALHELLARLVDNHHFLNWNQEAAPFTGWQGTFARQLDPTLPPIPYRELERHDPEDTVREMASIQQPVPLPAISTAFDSSGMDIRRFIADTATLPPLASLMRTTDKEGNRWIVLEATFRAQKPEPNDSTSVWEEQPYLEEWAALTSCMVPPSKEHETIVRLRDWRTFFEVRSRRGHVDCCFVGELGHGGRRCPCAAPSSVAYEIGWNTPALEAIPTAESYLWEGSIWDRSLNESVAFDLPSTFLQRVGAIDWDRAGLGTWKRGDEIVVRFFRGRDPGTSRALLAREDWLRSVLSSESLALVVGLTGERWRVDLRDQEPDPRLEFSQFAVVLGDGPDTFHETIFNNIEPGSA
jgi:hypothetical protein